MRFYINLILLLDRISQRHIWMRIWQGCLLLYEIKQNDTKPTEATQKAIHSGLIRDSFGIDSGLIWDSGFVRN